MRDHTDISNDASDLGKSFGSDSHGFKIVRVVRSTRGKTALQIVETGRPAIEGD
jgi:hypothetical protein